MSDKSSAELFLLSNGSKKGHNTFKQNHKERFEKHIYKCICQKCGKEYNIELTEEQYNKGKYSKFCSRSCANRHIVSEETKRKISKGVKKSETYKKFMLKIERRRIIWKKIR